MWKHPEIIISRALHDFKGEKPGKRNLSARSSPREVSRQHWSIPLLDNKLGTYRKCGYFHCILKRQIFPSTSVAEVENMSRYPYLYPKNITLLSVTSCHEPLHGFLLTYGRLSQHFPVGSAQNILRCTVRTQSFYCSSSSTFFSVSLTLSHSCCANGCLGDPAWCQSSFASWICDREFCCTGKMLSYLLQISFYL